MEYISNRRKRLLGTRFACEYGLDFDEVYFFGKEFKAKTEEEYKQALYLRFCIDSFADKEFPKEIYKKLWDINKAEFGLPPDVVYKTYKKIAELLCKQDESCEFKQWDNPNSELHSWSMGFIKNALKEKKKEHWGELKKEVYKQMYGLNLVE